MIKIFGKRKLEQHKKIDRYKDDDIPYPNGSELETAEDIDKELARVNKQIKILEEEKQERESDNPVKYYQKTYLGTFANESSEMLEKQNEIYSLLFGILIELKILNDKAGK